jgi:hypothetical protein
MRRLAVLALAALSACAPMQQEPPPARAVAMADDLPPMRAFAAGAPALPARSNAAMAADFLDLAFRMESGRDLPRMTRFDGPISVRLTGDVPDQMVADLRALIARLQTEAGIDIFLTGAPEAAITIEGISRADLNRAVPRAACFVVPRIDSWAAFQRARRTPMVDWSTLTVRNRAAIFVPTDVPPQEVRDCLHEELAQAIGPLNDLYRLPDSVFNDDNIHAVLTPFDMLMLRAYYAPELRNGITRGQAALVLPGLLARLNPAGQAVPTAPVRDTDRAWITAIETAVSGDDSALARRQAAARAVTLADAAGWGGARAGFAAYALGRLEVSHDPARALQAFLDAAGFYQADPQTGLHAAHVAVQLAAFALSAGDAQAVVDLTGTALPVAEAHQNAALLSTLMMFRAEALEMQGRMAEGAALRLDSLAYARYGFGSERNIRARLREIAALVPGGGS